ncbi:T9SS type A sorting domain-containing protein [Muriicola sp. Z0-33]|nr:T9SS type A sorting domain-containing protein [Muriicola sp. Z0-33]
MENPDVAIQGIMIHDVQGRVLVNQSTPELSKGDTYIMTTTELPAGVYYMSVINDTGVVGKVPLVVRK